MGKASDFRFVIGTNIQSKRKRLYVCTHLSQCDDRSGRSGERATCDSIASGLRSHQKVALRMRVLDLRSNPIVTSARARKSKYSNVCCLTLFVSKRAKRRIASAPSSSSSLQVRLSSKRCERNKSIERAGEHTKEWNGSEWSRVIE